MSDQLRVGDMALSLSRRTLHEVTGIRVDGHGYSHATGFLGTETCRKATYSELVAEIRRLSGLIRTIANERAA